MDAHTTQPVWFDVSLTRTTVNALMFLWRLRRRCLHVWATCPSLRTGLRGSVTP
ncbi:hypothetical protein [Chthonomonas sp.]|uniref:hypothetical protein n=1 Tax=Chthonomonas sp. TaxID=2282153 RepID=UPI0039C873D7